MKKIISVVAAIALLVSVFIAGRAAGISHAVTACAVSVDGQSVLIDLDGQLYEHTID